MLQERIHAAVPGGAAGLGVFQRALDAGEHSFFLHFEQFLVARFGEHDVLRTIVLDDVNGALASASSTAAMPRRLISWAGTMFMFNSNT